MTPTQGKLIVIDLMPILYRGYFVFLSKPRRTADGINTSSLSLLANTLEQMIRKFKPTHLAIAMESATPTFRHTLYPEYKAQREKMPEDIAAAILQAQELAAAWGIKLIQSDGYEADDILGTLATRGAAEGFEVIIASPDKDLGQLAGEHISIYRPGDDNPLSAEAIAAQWQIPSAARMIDYLALAGDSSDNIPGVPGVGQKTAIKLLNEYPSLEALLDAAPSIKGKTGALLQQHRDLALLSKQLVTIVRDIPLDITWDELAVPTPNAQQLGPLLKRYELKKLAQRLGIETETTESQSLFDFNTPAVAPRPSLTITEVTTPEQAQEMVGKLQTAREVGLAFLAMPDTTQGIALAFANATGEGWFLRITPHDATARPLFSAIAPLLSNASVEKVIHGARDFKRLLATIEGVSLENLYDTLLEHYLFAAIERHELENVAQSLLKTSLQYPLPSAKELADSPLLTNLSQPLAERAMVSLQLHQTLLPKLKEMQLLSLLENCEAPLSEVLLRMEQAGVRIDLPALRRFRSELESEILQLEIAIRNYTGAGINLASPKQVGEFLFGELKLDPDVKRTARGQFPTNEELLLKQRDKHPIIDLLLDWRACVKLKNTYVDRLPEHISPEDGRIHTTFHQTLTDTGRLSSSDPNLQNIPIRTERGQRIRAAFVARDEDWVLLSADYSQVELRLMAAMSGDKQMLNAFAKGADIHAQTASAVYNVPLEEVSPQQRARCKMVNFGILYGISAFGLAERLRIPRREAQQLIEAVLGHFPSVKQYMQELIETARVKGYAETRFGRRRALPDITSRNGAVRAAAERIALNMPIQGTAADIIKFAMVRIQKELDQRGLRTQMILQIHDELLFDVPKCELDIVKPLIQEIMETVTPLPVALPVAISAATDWLSAH
ncbi:MAG: DNA polymerase I [Kiritimatiellae bacterium]|nr:DNA polymerase I [Kiritimatiellia bacterium]